MRRTSLRFAELAARRRRKLTRSVLSWPPMADELTHFDADGAARMVSIRDKDETERTAVARALVRMAPTTLDRIRAGQIAKGDVLQIARIAAIAAAKSTSTAIPLCHPVRLTGVDVA